MKKTMIITVDTTHLTTEQEENLRLEMEVQAEDLAVTISTKCKTEYDRLPHPHMVVVKFEDGDGNPISSTVVECEQDKQSGFIRYVFGTIDLWEAP